ncbi:DUF1826 domain-containing protein [Pseudomonas sp. NPDC007930]|uniref:DUF1826 domain-containing protein n=1 Tax=Pseudomonas sp. NPDC007930 TaxID=3364417 RepID=UPI0036E42EED
MGQVLAIAPRSDTRRQALGTGPAVLAQIHQDEVNLAVWQRDLPSAAALFVEHVLAQQAPLLEQAHIEVANSAAMPSLASTFKHLPGHAAFVEDVTWLVEAYACLLGVSRVGLRLRTLDKPMCPRFHVDQVPVRLITTYQGPATQWLPGPEHSQAPEQMRAGDVALLKGERWVGNEGHGLAHRSPSASAEERRLILTLDWLA